MVDRFVIGSETDDTKKIELDEKGTKIAVPMTLYDGNGDQITDFTSSTPTTGNNTIGNGSQVIAVNETAIQLSTTSVTVKKVLIQANKTNRERIWI